MIVTMKKIGVLGTGIVGKTIANKLLQLGYEVKMGSRTSNNEKALNWLNTAGPNAQIGTFEEVTIQSDILFNCTKGEFAEEAIRLAGIENLKSKIIIDLSNPLDFSKGMPPTLIPQYANSWSMGEAIQELCPETFVVKTLNMVNCEVMVNAALAGDNASMFICGNDAESKLIVSKLLEEFGWNDIIDLGDIGASRGMEMLLPIWLRLWKATGTGHLAFKIVR
jgi:8-hydroxy-5-deazaflavin:NADPH oxidoreductase